MPLRLFSNRKGLKADDKLAQIEGIDADLRNALWNVFDRSFLRTYQAFSIQTTVEQSNLTQAFHFLWDLYFKRTIDTIPRFFQDAATEVRACFFGCQWYEVYDLLEFTAQFLLLDGRGEAFRTDLNWALERENSGYRMVGIRIAQLTSKEEIGAVEEALRDTEDLGGVNNHLRLALKHFSDRKAPDYRNCIKESISAVEAMVQLITGEKGAPLGKALSKVDKTIPIHGALRQAFSNLYGYTSDAEGIRHALLDEPTLSHGDAKFMLVSCSAFINYLRAKASEVGSPS